VWFPHPVFLVYYFSDLSKTYYPTDKSKSLVFINDNISYWQSILHGPVLSFYYKIIQTIAWNSISMYQSIILTLHFNALNKCYINLYCLFWLSQPLSSCQYFISVLIYQNLLYLHFFLWIIPLSNCHLCKSIFITLFETENVWEMVS
jgi:hypothetical protein